MLVYQDDEGGRLGDLDRLRVDRPAPWFQAAVGAVRDRHGRDRVDHVQRHREVAAMDGSPTAISNTPPSARESGCGDRQPIKAAGPGGAGAAGRRCARRLPGRRLRGAARGGPRARLGDRHLDRRDQRRADRRQRAAGAPRAAARILAAHRAGLAAVRPGAVAGALAGNRRGGRASLDGDARRARVLRAALADVERGERAGGRRSRLLLQHRAAARDAFRAPSTSRSWRGRRRA